MFGSVQAFGASSQAFGSSVGIPSTAAATQEAGARKPRQEEKQTCLPVTVRMVEAAVGNRDESGEEGLRFHGTEHGVLILVGLVEGWVRQSASAEFTVNDGTGRLKARYYSSGDLQDVGPGRYVSMFGQVRTAPVVHFAVAGMAAVESADEVSFHMIEVAHAALKLGTSIADFTTPPPKKPVLRSAALAEPATPNLEIPSAAATLETSPPKTLSLSGKPLRAAILGFLQAEGESRPEGVDLAAVCAHVGGTPASEVTAILEGLVGEGDVFTTIDDEHFQCV